MATKGQTPDGPGSADGPPDREEWQNGPVAGIPALLQPVAHALLQVRKELGALMDGFPDALLWERPAGVASVGFHLQHLSGVLDRLFTYARGEQLSEAQLEALKGEGRPPGAASLRGPEPLPVQFFSNATSSAGPLAKLVPSKGVITSSLVVQFNRGVAEAITQLSATDSQTLTDTRYVGRARVPSTVIGLLMHAAEHTTRHFGQLLVTVKVLNHH